MKHQWLVWRWLGYNFPIEIMIEMPVLQIFWSEIINLAKIIQNAGETFVQWIRILWKKLQNYEEVGSPDYEEQQDETPNKNSKWVTPSHDIRFILLDDK
jgi:hypothetical protein